MKNKKRKKSGRSEEKGGKEEEKNSPVERDPREGYRPDDRDCLLVSCQACYFIT